MMLRDKVRAGGRDPCHGMICALLEDPGGLGRASTRSELPGAPRVRPPGVGSGEPLRVLGPPSQPRMDPRRLACTSSQPPRSRSHGAVRGCGQRQGCAGSAPRTHQLRSSPLEAHRPVVRWGAHLLMHMSRASPTNPRTARASPRSVCLRKPGEAGALAGVRPAGLTSWRVRGARGMVIGRWAMARAWWPSH
jgi:hypothetical protein